MKKKKQTLVKNELNFNQRKTTKAWNVKVKKQQTMRKNGWRKQQLTKIMKEKCNLEQKYKHGFNKVPNIIVEDEESFDIEEKKDIPIQIVK